MYELATMNEQFIKPAPYLEAIERRLALVDHYSVASFLLVRTARPAMLNAEYSFVEFSDDIM
jgi:hypothetical protein